jgi:ABC-type multidrug transport system ATPase subunit
MSTSQNSRESSNSGILKSLAPTSFLSHAKSKVLAAIEGDVGFDETKPCSIAFKNVTKQAKGANGVVYPLVYQVSGAAQPGDMVAIMGMSGCGKTTLLQVIGGRMVDQVTGQILVQGIPFDKVMRSHISYVWQEDIFYPAPNFTVRDQLMFTSYVQMPYTDSHEHIVEAVNKVLESMHLEHCADTPVHFVSGGEKRRASIAKELLTDPRVLLIDEGTSGLDSAAAFDLLQKLKTLAVKNQIPVVMSIHQPSSRAFHLFDNVLFLSEGYCVYRGRPQDCLKYVTSFNFAMGAHQDNYNPADFMIDVLYSQVVDEKTAKWPRYALIAAWLEKEAMEDADAAVVSKAGGSGTGSTKDKPVGARVEAFTEVATADDPGKLPRL